MEFRSAELPIERRAFDEMPSIDANWNVARLPGTATSHARPYMGSQPNGSPEIPGRFSCWRDEEWWQPCPSSESPGSTRLVCQSARDSPSAVDVASVSDFHNHDSQSRVFNQVENPVIADANLPFLTCR